jgi:outer membrane protein
MFRNFFLLMALFATLPAHAGKIGVVDFQRAVAETNEGKAATARIETMYQNRIAEMTRVENELKKEYEDYQSRAMILSPEAQQDAQNQIRAKEGRYMEMQSQYQQELQQAQGQALTELSEKIKTVAENLGKEKGFDLVVEASVVLYAGTNVTDLTTDLVNRYNASGQ